MNTMLSDISLSYYKITQKTNSLFSGVFVRIIHKFLCLFKTGLKERTAQIFSCKETTHSFNLFIKKILTFTSDVTKGNSSVTGNQKKKKVPAV